MPISIPIPSKVLSTHAISEMYTGIVVWAIPVPHPANKRATSHTASVFATISRITPTLRINVSIARLAFRPNLSDTKGPPYGPSVQVRYVMKRLTSIPMICPTDWTPVKPPTYFGSNLQCTPSPTVQNCSIKYLLATILPGTTHISQSVPSYMMLTYW
jgi:hypothetical protein